MRSLFLAVLGASILVPASSPAAQQSCDTRDEMVEYLADRYGEHPVGFGASTAGTLVELLVSGADAPRPTWSIIVTVPGGPTCLQAAGEGWRMLPKDSLDPET